MTLQVDRGTRRILSRLLALHCLLQTLHSDLNEDAEEFKYDHLANLRVNALTDMHITQTSDGLQSLRTGLYVAQHLWIIHSA